ncbi:MAG TPA: TetR/AcrR family transcriptional regulator [Burkholderiaceae bacterium]|nr:TetR/AcrR family transcriptional regulator [Burkholderiaceae bacterium]
MNDASLPKPGPRSTYRHGDLRRALVEAGLALAREGGPDAIALREVTRRAGVVPNAAYRHFGSLRDLREAVRGAALAALARAMEAELGTAPGDGDALARARARVRAVGLGYLRFAHDEPGLFRTAFAVDAAPVTRPDERAGPGGLDPFELLGSALDALVAAGGLPARRRRHAEYVAWSAVHGYAMLIVDGPLRALDREGAAAVAAHLLDMVERGL